MGTGTGMSAGAGHGKFMKGRVQGHGYMHMLKLTMHVRSILFFIHLL